MNNTQDRFVVTLLLALVLVVAPAGSCNLFSCFAAARPVPQEDAAETENNQPDGQSEFESDAQPESEAPADSDLDDRSREQAEPDQAEPSPNDSADEKKDGNKADEKQADEQEEPKSSLRGLLSRTLSRDADRTSKFSKQDKNFVSLFEPLVEPVSQSTVQIYSGGKRILLGMVVSRSGLILTKASELQGDLKCKLADGRLLSADVFGIHPQTDLAMLKVDTTDLVPGEMATELTPKIGYWVATPLPEEEPLIGIVSVNAREIPPSSPFIGIIMTNVDDRDGVRITMVVSSSPAEEAGLWVNDLILKLDDTDTRDIDGLRDALGQYDPGERVTLTVMRGQKEKKIKLTLAEKDKISPDNRRSNQQNSMGSKLSRRRKAFPMAFQHDSMLTARNCGGPIVNLNGDVVGLNIARAGRVASLALPVAVLKPVISKLLTGELAPAIVNREAINRVNEELQELAEKLGHLPDKRDVLQQKLAIESARREELAAIQEDVQTRLKALEKKSGGYKQELDAVTNDIKATERVRKKLTAELQQLKTGRR